MTPLPIDEGCPTSDDVDQMAILAAAGLWAAWHFFDSPFLYGSVYKGCGQWVTMCGGGSVENHDISAEGMRVTTLASHLEVSSCRDQRRSLSTNTWEDTTPRNLAPTSIAN